jgi:hypothetical protein
MFSIQLVVLVLALAAQHCAAFTAPMGARRSLNRMRMSDMSSEKDVVKAIESSTEENEIRIDMDSLAEESVCIAKAIVAVRFVISPVG